jgi:hypothetical protein
MAKSKSTRTVRRAPAVLPTQHLALIAQRSFADMFEQMFRACVSYNPDAELRHTMAAIQTAWAAETRRREMNWSLDGRAAEVQS